APANPNAPPAATPAAPQRGSETVLVVEDQDLVRSLVRLSLEAEGYHVLIASDAQEALAVCETTTQPIHLLLTDGDMPRMSGPQLAPCLARLRPATRVLYMSGFADSALARHQVPGGAGFLAKPFTPDFLVRKVREALDRDPGMPIGAGHAGGRLSYASPK